MKFRTVVMSAGVAMILATPAMANGPIVGVSRVVKGPAVVIYTDRNGYISKDEFLAYESRRFDEAASLSRSGRVRNDEGRLMTKAQFMAYESSKFDQMDVTSRGKISSNDFSATEITIIEPAAGPEVSTSRPQAYNQAIPTSHISGGADGAGGWTAQ
ncbi:MAG TPA: hypothetical protein VL625_12870 [Patescibacteria group bacterium]|jgi:hypothetical protein|nr:hypothetical protein [Patescibacteria group bacterium]